MTDTPAPLPEPDSHFAAATELCRSIRSQIGQALVGQSEVVDQTLIALLAAGHVLLEGVPGLGKTLLVLALAKTFSGKSARIQFTPDLMPSDVTGHAMYDMATGTLRVRRGPAFTNLLLADEINRAPAKTQSALLEVMQEQQITIEGESIPLERPFMTLATQNPVEQEGTYPLPEAQLDRFLLKVRIDYPGAQEEVDLVRRVTKDRIGDRFLLEGVTKVASVEQIVAAQRCAAEVVVDDGIVDYTVRIARATREHEGVVLGAGPRGAIALVRVARAKALLEGRSFVTPDDVKALALPALRHRITVAPELELERQDADSVLRGVLEKVEAPRH
jgi:MoxR-like ATPase